MKTILLISLMSLNVYAANLNVEVLDFGTQNRSKIIELEESKMKIQDTIAVYKKSMSKTQKEQLTKDLKALRKCKFQQSCKDETGKSINK